jgi:hypothetical protein
MWPMTPLSSLESIPGHTVTDLDGRSSRVGAISHRYQGGRGHVCDGAYPRYSLMKQVPVTPLFNPQHAKRGTYEHSQTCTFGNSIRVYGCVFHVRDRLRLDKGRGRTTGGNRQSSSGCRSSSRPANRTTTRACGTKSLRGERENYIGRSHDGHRQRNINAF